MTSSSSATLGSNKQNTRNWSSKEWFTLLVVLILICTGVYIAAHSKMGVPGCEYSHFTKDDINRIDNILATSTIESFDQYKPSHQRDVNINDGFLDNYSEVEQNKNEIETTSKSKSPVSKSQLEQDKANRVHRVMVYINSQYGGDIHSAQIKTIEEYLTTFSRQESKEFLSDLRLKVRSYFWLTGPMVYLEVIFWVIIGVLCSMLFSVAMAARKSSDINGYSNRELIYQIAKLFYAPFIAIALLLAYSYFKNSTTLNIDANEGVIVFAFIIGLYSGTIMEIFERIKYVIFNSGSGNEPSSKPQSIEHSTTTVTKQDAVKPNIKQEATNTPAPKEVQPSTSKETPAPAKNVQEKPLKEATQHSATSFENLKPLPESLQKSTRKKALNENQEIEEVNIDLKLDFSGLFDEEKSELQRLGFNKAIVTLHNVNGKDIIPASKLSDDLTTFVATGVKPGIYIARATLSQRLRDEQIINLFGEKTAYVTQDKPGLELYVKKYEAID